MIEVFPIHTGAVQRTPRRAGEANEEVPRRQPGRGPAHNVSFPVVLVAPVADLAVNPFALERSKYAAQSILGQRARHKAKKAEGVPLSEKAKDLSFALVGKRRPRSRRGHKGSQNRRFKVRQKEVRPKVLCKVPGASAMNHNAVRVKVPIRGELLRPTSQVRNKDRLRGGGDWGAIATVTKAGLGKKTRELGVPSCQVQAFTPGLEGIAHEASTRLGKPQ